MSYRAAITPEGQEPTQITAESFLSLLKQIFSHSFMMTGSTRLQVWDAKDAPIFDDTLDRWRDSTK